MQTFVIGSGGFVIFFPRRDSLSFADLSSSFLCDASDSEELIRPTTGGLSSDLH